MTVQDKEDIRKVFEEHYSYNVRERDLELYGQMYTENAIWMPPDSPDRIGINDILEGFASQIAKQDIDPNFTAEEIEVFGDFGYVLGFSIAIIKPRDGTASRTVKFRALWLMKKEDDTWKIDRQIWNTKP